MLVRIRRSDDLLEHRDQRCEVIVIGSRASGRVVLLAVDRTPIELPARFEGEAVPEDPLRPAVALPKRVDVVDLLGLEREPLYELITPQALEMLL